MPNASPSCKGQETFTGHLRAWRELQRLPHRRDPAGRPAGVRDIAEDDEPHPAERAANPAPGRHDRRASRSGHQRRRSDSLEGTSTPVMAAPALPPDTMPNDGSGQVTSQPQAGTDSGSAPAQYLLPGLGFGADHERGAGEPKRPRQHSTSSNRKALRAMQMELWLDEHDPASSA